MLSHRLVALVTVKPAGRLAGKSRS